MVKYQPLAAGMAAHLILASRLLASTIHVPADQPTLQQGIDAAVEGDTVLVAPGTYTGPSNQNLDFHGKDLVLRSETGAQSTVIDCSGGRGFNLHSGETAAAIIDGFTVTGGSVSGDPGDTGGGIACDGASPTIRNCIVTENFSFWDGAGISLVNSTATLNHCIVSNNRAARNAGGILCSNTVITNCVITGNIAGDFDFGSGGGVYAGGLVYIIDCTISGNTANSSGDNAFSVAEGGGIVAGGTVRLTRCTVRNNTAQAINDDADGNHARGGGARLAGDVVVTDCVFRGNRAESVSGPDSRLGNEAEGGGVYCTDAIFTRCQFIANVARSEGNPAGNSALGGGVACDDGTFFDCLFADNGGTASAVPPIEQRGDGGALAVGAGTHIAGCTIAGSAASTSGAGIYLRTAGIATIENSIIAFSSAAEAVSCAGGGAPFLSCTDVFGNAGGDWVGCIAGLNGQNNNFSADPLFCGVASGNYALDADSPCAPGNSPGGCGLVGAFPVGCGAIGIPDAGAPAAIPAIRVVPNPISPDGRILWTNAVAGPQSLRLYDPLGRLVLRHELGIRPAGAQEVQWSEIVGQKALRAGVYFVTFEAKEKARAGSARVMVIR